MIDKFFQMLISNWWGILIIIISSLAILLLLSILLYRQIFKRFYDIALSGLAIIILSPIFLFLIVFGAIKLKGSPFFTQSRPGKINKKTGKEKIFKLIKFRTMTNEKNKNGELLPDEKRLTKYGKFLRATSLDELPELFNIFLGQMSIVGPRPLLVKYLPLYSDEQRKRHIMRPGLTGLAQVNGRNAISWEDKFNLDVHYVNNVSFWGDIAIILNIAESTYRGYENLTSEPTVETLCRLADYYNISLDELIGRDFAVPTDSLEDELLQTFRQLDLANKGRVIGFAVDRVKAQTEIKDIKIRTGYRG